MKKNWKRRRPIFSALPSGVEKPKIRWKIWPIFWLAFKRMAFLIGVTVIVLALIVAITASRLVPETPQINLPDEIVLVLDLKEGFLETAQVTSFADPFAAPGQTIHALIEQIDAAAKDSRVKGLVARYDGGHYALAHIEEFHKALNSFEDTGKFTKIYSPSYGDMGSLSGYYLASAFDEIWMQPMGTVSIPGLGLEAPYIRPLLDKIGVYPQFFKRKEYKTAYESLTNSQMSTENRMMLKALLVDSEKSVINDIAQNREKTPQELQRLFDQGLFTAIEAYEAKLVDILGYPDQMIKTLKIEVKGDAEASDDLFVRLGNYSRAQKARHTLPGFSRFPKVAIIHANGMIMQSPIHAQTSGIFMSQPVAAADDLVPAIFEASDDPDIKAIILRVNSPGGSPVASESILRAMHMAKEKGKLVIVSMGPTAASGGYWIASYADHIFALPTTITGSIGVVGGKFSLQQLWQDLGVNWDRVQTADNADILSPHKPFTPTQETRMQALLDNVYENFVARVAEGRNMTIEDVEEVARGRVWSGQGAKDAGLVDSLGGLQDALDLVAETLLVKGRSELNIITLPKPKTKLEQLLEFLSDQGQVTSNIGQVLSQLRILLGFEPQARTNPVMVLEPTAIN